MFLGKLFRNPLEFILLLIKLQVLKASGASICFPVHSVPNFVPFPRIPESPQFTEILSTFLYFIQHGIFPLFRGNN